MTSHDLHRLAAIVVALTLLPSLALANSLNRDSDPVVLDAGLFVDMLGRDPATVVAFRYDAGLGWIQIPVQVDERATKDYGEVYNSTPVAFAALAYNDAGTFMGPDPDPTIDANDEIVFMAKDAGDDRAPTPFDPVGVVPGSRVEVQVLDPLSPTVVWAYLFESSGGLTPDAGENYVTYTFTLLAGPYLTSYNTTTGPNPENSTVVTDYYRMHFSDRWIRDEIEIIAGTASGADILDRHKNLFAPGNCARSEDTFSAGEGAFFVNKDGPVRAIRSYMGANSGPLTQRDHFFYERRHDVRTTLRVHAIQGVMEFYDYSAAATGMTYYNDANLGGIDVDGSMTGDVFTQSPIQWEMVTGAQGTLAFAHMVETTIPGFTYTSYWLDDSTPMTTQCTGDGSAYGSSGVWVTNPIPNTDPVFAPPPFWDMRTVRIAFAEAPNQTVTFAQDHYAQATSPLLGGPTVLTGIADRSPAPADLGQNHPNPFNPTTTIAFMLRERALVELVVFDTRGRRVRTLVKETFPPGFHEASWDGLNDSGQAVGSGVYFYQMRTGSTTHTKKMVLLK